MSVARLLHPRRARDQLLHPAARGDLAPMARQQPVVVRLFPDGCLLVGFNDSNIMEARSRSTPWQSDPVRLGADPI
jgi:hypothetical protein